MDRIAGYIPDALKGVGKELLQYGIKEFSVNEQNPHAMGFYEHMGFHAFRRTKTDEQGNLYPIIYIKRDVWRRYVI